ncbi:B-box zinc finger protein 20-like [Andrographis paniculata]|uniref:B-box zinc finger protein 20-like n=1 Tax=Andrographis paniculata TaxID=175694 RepID=UPI0021E8716D|nr:B-box zinc finger protein 20-like [Andrographis paniculata]
MKIQCDVCDEEEASVFCVADEAALCAACDCRVHHANKLAGKHHRYSLRPPSPNRFPICDICQERRSFVFCQQDRAIMCKDCDSSIHGANEHTKKHSRFLLTGVEIRSSSSSLPSSTSSLNSNNNSSEDAVPKNKPGGTGTIPAASGTPSTANGTTTTAESTLISSSESSFSEYLMETLPGWHVKEFLHSPSPSPSPASLHGFSFKNGDESDLVPTGLGVWVPQSGETMMMSFGAVTDGFMAREFPQSKELFTITDCSNRNSTKLRRKHHDQGKSLAVAIPQISSSNLVSERF